MRVFIIFLMLLNLSYADKYPSLHIGLEVPVVELNERERVAISHNELCQDYEYGTKERICDRYTLFDDGIGDDNYYKKETLPAFVMYSHAVSVGSYYLAEVFWNNELYGKRYNSAYVKVLKKTENPGYGVPSYTFEIYLPKPLGLHYCPSTAPYFSSATRTCTSVCDSIPNYVSRVNCYCNERGWGNAENLEDVIANGTEDKRCDLHCEKAPISKNYTEKECQTKCDPTIIKAERIDECLNECRKGKKTTIKLTNSQCTTDDLDINSNSDGKINPPDTKPDDEKPKPNKPDENKPHPSNPDNNKPNTPENNNNNSGNSSNNNGNNSHSAEIGNGEGGTNPGNSNNNSGSAHPGKDHNGSKIIPPNNPKDNGECKGLECGKPDKLPGEDIKKGTEKMFSSFEGFKNNLIDKTDSLKNDLNDLKNKIITNKFQNLTNYEVTRCPYKANFTTPYFSIPLNFDVCMAVSILYPVIYFLTFISALYLGIKFFLRILMRV